MRRRRGDPRSANRPAPRPPRRHEGRPGRRRHHPWGRATGLVRRTRRLVPRAAPRDVAPRLRSRERVLRAARDRSKGRIKVFKRRPASSRRTPLRTIALMPRRGSSDRRVSTRSRWKIKHARQSSGAANWGCSVHSPRNSPGGCTRGDLSRNAARVNDICLDAKMPSSLSTQFNNSWDSGVRHATLSGALSVVVARPLAAARLFVDKSEARRRGRRGRRRLRRDAAPEAPG